MANDGFFLKQPQEIKPFDVDFVDALADEDEIATVAIKVFDSDGVDVSSTILNGAATITTGRDGADRGDTRIIQMVKVGSDGDKYNVEVLATTDDGAKPEVDIELRIKKKGTN